MAPMNSKLKQIVEQAESLDPFPSTAVRVLEATLAGDPDPLEIATIIKFDAGITAKVLRMANSSAQGSAVEIESIEQASVKLGAAELLRMVMASAAQSFYSGLGSSTPRSGKSLHTESMMNAIAARMVAQKRNSAHADVAFTVGLLMNMAHIVLDRFVRIERDEILARVDLGKKMLRAEQEVLGTTHAELGEHMARIWGFPDSLCDAIGHHHTPEGGADVELCQDVNVAEALTWQAICEEGTQSLAYGVASSTISKRAVHLAELAALRDALPVAVESQRHLLGLS